MASLAERIAALKARKAPVGENRQPEPSTDAADLVESFRRPEPVVAPRDQRLRGARIAVIDTETTGLDPATSRIVEVAVVVIDGLGLEGVEPVVAFSTRVNPGEPIPEAASKVHGITDADVADAPTWSEVWPKVLEAVGDRWPAAYNAPFDVRMLGAEAKRMGAGLGTLAWSRGWLDPLVLGRGLDKFERGKKLTDIARRRGVQLAAHGGPGDAVATGHLFLVLVRQAIVGVRGFKAPEFPTVATWLAWQREQALAQEADFATFLRKQGRSDPIECPWHELELVPLPQGALPGAQPPPVRPAACNYCERPIVWVIGQDGAKHPCDPDVVRAAPQAEVLARPSEELHANPPGTRYGFVLDDGTVRHGYVDPTGAITGRISHWITCPRAGRVKADQRARGAA